MLQNEKIILSKISSMIILLLSLKMLFKGLSTLEINKKYKDYTSSIIYKDYKKDKTNYFEVKK